MTAIFPPEFRSNLNFRMVIYKPKRGRCIGVQGTVAADIVAYMEAMLHRPGGHPDGGPMHVDGAYSWFRRAHGGLITVLAVPEVAYQRSSRTDIGQTRWFDRIPLLSMGITLIRRFKDRFRFL